MNKISKIRGTKMNEQGGLCHYCGQPMWADDVDGFCERYRLSTNQAENHRCTAEHLRARCEGGKDTPANIVAACYFCNRGRHRLRNPPRPDRFMDYVRQRLAKGKWHRFVAIPL